MLSGRVVSFPYGQAGFITGTERRTRCEVHAFPR